MAARLIVRAVAALVILAALAGCDGGSGSRPSPPSAAPATPVASLSAQMEGTAAAVRAALAGSGRRLDRALVPYRPSEPPSFARVPRAVFQTGLSDPDQGFVIVYELPDAVTASARGRELATHVASGFGQTNYPGDARFSIAQVGSTLVYTWWSPARASDRTASEAVFDAVASVGMAIPVTR